MAIYAPLCSFWLARPPDRREMSTKKPLLSRLPDPNKQGWKSAQRGNPGGDEVRGASLRGCQAKHAPRQGEMRNRYVLIAPWVLSATSWPPPRYDPKLMSRVAIRATVKCGRGKAVTTKQVRLPQHYRTDTLTGVGTHLDHNHSRDRKCPAALQRRRAGRVCHPEARQQRDAAVRFVPR